MEHRKEGKEARRKEGSKDERRLKASIPHNSTFLDQSIFKIKSWRKTRQIEERQEGNRKWGMERIEGGKNTNYAKKKAEWMNEWLVYPIPDAVNVEE